MKLNMERIILVEEGCSAGDSIGQARATIGRLEIRERVGEKRAFSRSREEMKQKQKVGKEGMKMKKMKKMKKRIDHDCTHDACTKDIHLRKKLSEGIKEIAAYEGFKRKTVEPQKARTPPFKRVATDANYQKFFENQL